MPTFFFDIHQVSGTVEDDTIGTELPDLHHALAEAKQTLADMTRDAIAQESASDLSITIRDEDGAVIAVQRASLSLD